MTVSATAGHGSSQTVQYRRVLNNFDVLGLLEAIEPGELLSMRAQLLMAFSPKQHRPLYAKNCFERNPGPLPCAAIVQASVAAVNTGTTVEGRRYIIIRNTVKKPKQKLSDA